MFREEYSLDGTQFETRMLKFSCTLYRCLEVSQVSNFLSWVNGGLVNTDNGDKQPIYWCPCLISQNEVDTA